LRYKTVSSVLKKEGGRPARRRKKEKRGAKIALSSRGKEISGTKCGRKISSPHNNGKVAINHLPSKKEKFTPARERN